MIVNLNFRHDSNVAVESVTIFEIGLVKGADIVVTLLASENTARVASLDGWVPPPLPSR